MSFRELIERGVDTVRELPGVLQWRKARFDRRFAENRQDNLFRGVFADAAQALASAPATRPQSYDNAASSELYLKRLEIDDHDYPAMFWLQRSLDQGLTHIADVGGSVGIKYIAFRKLMAFPEDMVWRVFDMPAVVERGRAFAESQQTGPALDFCDDLAQADGMPVLYASGVLQYLPMSLAELLRGFKSKPQRIIINTMPIHQRRSFFTLNSIGTAYCAYRVQARSEFIDEIESCGYWLRAEWRNVGKQMRLPFDRELSLQHYSGFCFDIDARR